ncbi:serine/threonine-protein kinase [Nocardiopsis rhodophaea]|uniref:serine/threonine-protein kinase n=2 Tax=Nocardiopsis rhodophaea TaxID=280238 RepID=UPI0031E25576
MAKSNDGGERVIADRYRLRSKLGAGGMGVVWLAWDPHLAREVAVKEVLLPDGLTESQRAEAHARVRREAQSAARVTHPSVVTIHDVLDVEGHPWVVMELIRGRSLQEELSTGGPLDLRRVAAIARELLEAVRAAHAAGVIHRDIKPANVMLTEGDRVTLTDFGIATVEGGSTITRTGTLVGSPEYMPPERVRGEQATSAADLWSVGVTLYAMCEGASPFHRESVTAAIAAVLSAPVPPTERAGPLAPLIRGLLDRDPARRLTADQALGLLGESTPSPGRTATADRERQDPPPHPQPPQGPTTPYPSGPVTPRPPGSVTPRPNGPVTPRPGGPSTPHPVGGQPTGAMAFPPAGGWSAPAPAPPPGVPPAAGAHTRPGARRSRSGWVGVLLAGGVLGLLALVPLVWLAMYAAVDGPMRGATTYSNAWYAIDHPSDWEVRASNGDDRAVEFTHPDGDAQLHVESWTIEDSDPQSAYEVLVSFDEEAEAGGYETIELVGSAPGFPASWDVAYAEIEYVDGSWTTPGRRLAAHVVVKDGEGYVLVWDVPAHAATDYQGLHRSILDSFEPRA